MIIKINQHKLALTSKYNIFIDENETYFAKRAMAPIMAHITLLEARGDQKILEIKRKFDFFKARYEIALPDHSVVEFKTHNFWRAHFQCKVRNDQYDIYTQKRRKTSVFKNDVQVAWWEKTAVSVLSGDQYTLTANDDARAELLVAFCLVLDNYKKKNKGNDAIRVDVGRLGPVAKKFNPDWRPNSKHSKEG